MSDHKFKDGERALIPVIVKQADLRELKIRAERSGREFYCFAQDLIPAPREGEYRLTLDELQDLCYDFHHDYGEGSRGEHHDEFVEQWLANRKEDA